MEFEAKLVKLLKKLGIPEGEARVYTALLLSGRPMDVYELSRVTGYARSSVSLYLSILCRFGLITRVRKGRKFVYEVVRNFIEIERERIRSVLQEDLEPLLKEVERGYTGVPQEVVEMLIELRAYMKKIVGEEAK